MKIVEKEAIADRSSRRKASLAERQSRARICFDGLRPPDRNAPPAIQPDGTRLPKNQVLRTFLYRLHILREPTKACAPLRQDGSNLVVIFLGDEIVQSQPVLSSVASIGSLAR